MIHKIPFLCVLLVLVTCERKAPKYPLIRLCGFPAWHYLAFWWKPLRCILNYFPRKCSSIPGQIHHRGIWPSVMLLTSSEMWSSTQLRLRTSNLTRKKKNNKIVFRNYHPELIQSHNTECLARVIVSIYTFYPW